MTDSVKLKPVNLEDLNAHSKVLFNKGVGNRGTCTTASATAAKEVTFGTTFSLTDSATALVRFTYGISAENATLAVTYTDSSGSSVTTDAKAIYYRGAALPAGLVQPKDTLLIKYNGTQWDVIGTLNTDTTYDAGTAAMLETGTDQTERTWQAKIIADYVKGRELNWLDLMSLSHDYTFKKNDVLFVGGALYKCTATTTTKPPFDFVFDANNSIVVDRINGYDSPVVDNDTLNAGWEKVVEINDRYYVEHIRQEINQAKQDKLTFDILPTYDSSNPVTSHGIYSALYRLPWRFVKQESVGGSSIIPGGIIRSGYTLYLTNITSTNNLQLEYTQGTAARWTIIATFGADASFYLTFSRSGLQTLLSLQGQSGKSVKIEVYFDGESFYYDQLEINKSND